MKILLAALIVACALGMVNGRHSGTMRGAGADVKSLGERMQR